jgi:phage gp36-like protein
MALEGTPISGIGTGPNGFTNETLITRLYSVTGITNMFEDVSPTEKTNILNQIISDAEETIISRIGQFYDPSDLASSTWIQSRCTWIAAYYVSQRAGQEHYFQSKFDSALTELDAMATGELPLRGDIPLKGNITPSMTNLRISDYYAVQKIRAIESISVGGSYPGKATDFDTIWGWF